MKCRIWRGDAVGISTFLFYDTTTFYTDELKNTMNTCNPDSWLPDKILIGHFRKAGQICFQYGKLGSKTYKWYIAEAITNKKKLRITRFLTPFSISLHEKLITQEVKKFFPFLGTRSLIVILTIPYSININKIISTLDRASRLPLLMSSLIWSPTISIRTFVLVITVWV